MQTPTLIAMLNSDLTHREIFMDGRKLEASPNPTWMGYSVGHFEGNTLVVDSNGYTDRSWLDDDGHPHSEDLHITERYTRPDFGHAVDEITLTDPKVFSKPVHLSIKMELMTDTEMIEYVCENEKDRGHMNLPAGTEAAVAPEVLSRYVGTYDVVDPDGHKSAAEVTVEGARIFVNYNRQGKQPLTAQTENTFSLAGTLYQFLGSGADMELLIRYVEGDERGPRRK